MAGGVHALADPLPGLKANSHLLKQIAKASLGDGAPCGVDGRSNRLMKRECTRRREGERGRQAEGRGQDARGLMVR